LDLRVLEGGVPFLALFDQQDRPRFKVDLAGAQGEPSLVLVGEDGKPRVGAMIDSNGRGVVGPLNPSTSS